MSARVLPKKTFELYRIFEKIKNPQWKENMFIRFKPQLNNKYNDMVIMMAYNITEMNLYYIDFPIDKLISPNYIIHYIKDINIRNACSNDMLRYKIVETKGTYDWVEEEMYKDCKNRMICFGTKFDMICYAEDDMTAMDEISSAKYYIAYKILNSMNNYVLRFEIVFNTNDMDQEVDLYQYIGMIYNILNAIYTKFKIIKS